MQNLLKELIFNKIKRKFRKKKYFVPILIICSVLIFYFGNFLSNYMLIKETNPFTFLFGITAVDIEPTNIITQKENQTMMKLKITNSGDKNIDRLFINYQYCDSDLKTALLEENKLRILDNQYFQIETISVNKLCNPVTPYTNIDIFLDENQNCYIRIISPKSKTCGFCNMPIKVFGNGKLIYDKKIVLPFREIEVSTFILLSKYLASGLDINFSPKNYKPFKLSECTITNNITKLMSLPYNLGNVSFVMFDPYTACVQGKDPEWCAQYVFVNP